MAEQPGKKQPPPQSPLDEARSPVCSVGFCPLCRAVVAGQRTRPDVAEHVVSAGRELMLAVRALLRRSSAPTETPPVEHIDVG